MAKDPAFLFYPNDWLGGTMGMTFEEKGAYMDLLMMQFNRGRLSQNHIIRLIGEDLWREILPKFTQDQSGLFYNIRLEEEQNKRQKYTESRRNNRNSNQFNRGASVDASNSDDNITNIYIIKDVDSGNIKIGASVNPKNRLSTIRSRQNKNVELVAVAENCTLGEEKQIHKHFHEYNISGDWFCVDEKDVIKYITTHITTHMSTHMSTHMENENENVNKDNKEGKKQKIINPELKEVVEYFRDNGYTSDSAKKAFEYYSVADWHDSKGSKVKNWKQKMRGVWFKPENKEVKKPKLFNDDDDSFIPTGKSI
jgi:uncharacterized protein YdaU (DUF1376 family)